MLLKACKKTCIESGDITDTKMEKTVKALGGIWTESRLNKLKKLRLDAIHDQRTIFTFEEQETDTQFAKYLIEYVEQELAKR